MEASSRQCRQESHYVKSMIPEHIACKTKQMVAKETSTIVADFLNDMLQCM